MLRRALLAAVVLALVPATASASTLAKANPVKAAHARMELARIAHAHPAIWKIVKRDVATRHFPSRAKILVMGDPPGKARAADNACSPQCSAYIDAIFWDMTAYWNSGVTYWQWQALELASILEKGGWITMFDQDYDGGVGFVSTGFHKAVVTAHGASCYKTLRRDHWYHLWTNTAGPKIGRVTVTIDYWCGSGGVISGYQTDSSGWGNEPFCMAYQDGSSPGHPLAGWFGSDTGHTPHYVLGVGMFGNLGWGYGPVCVQDEGGHAIVDVNPYGGIWHDDYWGF